MANPLAFTPPMLAKLVRTLPEGPDWEYELKLDGYRLQAIKDADKVRLYSRRGNDFTRKFAKIANGVSKIKATSLILDGEAVAVDHQGKPSFQMLQNRSRLPAGWTLVYYAFDLLHLNGQDLKDRPLRERRALLENLLGNSGVLLSQSLPGTLTQIIHAVKTHGLEGVIAKRLDSKYQPDRRSDHWLKLPLKPSQHLVIGAYRLDGKRLELLLVGQFEGSKLLFVGKVHQGLNPANRRALLKLLQPLAIDQCPFANLPTTGRTSKPFVAPELRPRSDVPTSSGNKKPSTFNLFRSEGVTADEMADYTWLRPEIEAEIKFAEVTTAGVLRHAEFVSLREM